MVWAYYDESGEYDAAGVLLNMSIGGCVARRDNWQKLDADWRKVLSDEGLPYFHMTDFEAWVRQYDFKLEGGERDKVRHKRIINKFLEIMADYVEGFYGYGAIAKYDDRAVSHRNTVEECVGAAVKDIVLRVWAYYEEPINLVFGKQNHFPSELVSKYVNYYDYPGKEKRIGSVSHCDTFKVTPLQAADILAYEVARCQRANRDERYPFKSLVATAKERGIPFSLTWAPFRSRSLGPSRGRGA